MHVAHVTDRWIEDSAAVELRNMPPEVPKISLEFVRAHLRT